MLGARLGLNYQFDFGLNATVLALWRNYNYQVYHAALELKRKDRQQIYLAILKYQAGILKTSRLIYC
ncbi:Uncharacterised protein [Rodentibacter pneumotropicus]|uniref:Uncharacterized protein n=1 Tax=Rodentibacter pneumotropicus TaxID=758 RepID=A0A3S4U4P9_9PAST|nr:Uncharacterised protein [Rodentibacter pneumotropicus]